MKYLIAIVLFVISLQSSAKGIELSDVTQIYSVTKTGEVLRHAKWEGFEFLKSVFSEALNSAPITQENNLGNVETIYKFVVPSAEQAETLWVTQKGLLYEGKAFAIDKGLLEKIETLIQNRLERERVLTEKQMAKLIQLEYGYTL